MRADIPAAERFGRVLMSMGLTGGAMSGAFLAAETVGVINGVRSATVQAAGMMLVFGWAWASSGSMSGRSLNSVLDLRLWPWMALSAPAWLAAGVIEWKLPPQPRTMVPLLFAAALAVVALVLTRPDRPSARTVVSSGLAMALVMFAVSSLFRLELYPLSGFRMYSGARLDPYELTIPAVTGWVDGAEVDLSNRLGRATITALVDDPDPERVEQRLDIVARAYERDEGGAVDRIQVVDQVWRVIPYPGDAAVEMVRSEERIDYDRS